MSRKIKYSLDFKLSAVKQVLDFKFSIRHVSYEIGINKSQLKKWIRYYQTYGLEGLIPRSKNNHYTPDFKLKVISQVQKRGLSFKQASLKFDIPSDSTVLRWYQTYEREGKSGFYKPRGRPKKLKANNSKKKSKKPLTREQELLIENESLRCELDLLKKLQALAQAREKKQ